ncbi:MutS-related protein [Pseudoflavitalea rhizosphaerae]|uniref:MutS-related protein n=1 Tax=Pseudoflavitalea rhizosphaerae TaxID=1884793 RepID=UPI000F8EB7DC|nr:DNA mismatch repair protein [Pseudoflavitalea rhizosphaerae]
MNFSIDKQTQDELNLMGKFRQGSVYHLFSRVKTQGGERLLEQMFRQPLTSHQEINTRSSIFRSFGEAAVVFPFDPQQVSLMREFLDAGSSKSAGRILVNAVVKKTMASLTRDTAYKKNLRGLQAAIVTLNKCHSFLGSLQTINAPFSERVKEISQLLSGKELTAIRDTDIYRALPLKKLVSFNYILKVKFSREMENILHFIHETDVYISVSDTARQKEFGYATAFPAENNLLDATGLRHPCIDAAIGNNIKMDSSSNILFLTGANMAGKSTLMKSVGIGMYLAHMGFPVAATKMEFSVREGLYSSINVADNIGLGYSHFYAEVVRVKQAADATAGGKRLMLLFDELFKGTNVKDAYDGTLAVTQGFAEYRECLFIVSTHIIEVGEALNERHNIRFVYMPTVMEGHKPRYTYRLKEGITEDRQGMMIIANEGILEMLNEEASGQ